MLRASQMSSEEALPALGAALSDNLLTESESIRTNLLSSKKLSPSYGLNSKLTASHRHIFPKAVVFILITKFFEAFAANGIRTILALYLRDYLFFSESFATIMLHIFNFIGQFLPIMGAIIADCYWGNVKTIGFFYYIYGVGWMLLLLTSFPNTGIPLIFLISAALLLVAVGNGSIRACTTSLGALQYRIPEQATQLEEYFSLYYFVYYFGILLSKLVPPAVRANTYCYGRAECYPAVFGSLGASFFAAWLFFSLGKFLYKPEKLAHDNILLRFYGCVKHALAIKFRRGSPKTEKPKYWLHNAIGKYEQSFVNDVAKVLKICKLFLPLAFYYALLVQQDSSWTFQASMMNTTIAGTFAIQPDQAKAIGPIFLFMLIPLWQYVCVPLLRKYFEWELKPLQSAIVGGIFSAISFMVAGLLQRFISQQAYQAVNIIWQMPQFMLLMLGELLLSIPGLQFAFTQAPASMKSVVTAAFFINNAFGNLIVVIVTKFNLFNSQSDEYFFYAIMMLLCVIIFTIMANDYSQQEQADSFYALNTSKSYVALSDKDAEDNGPSTSGMQATSKPTSEQDYVV